MKALIAMSGGVDSSMAALLMKQRGYECIGCTMKLYDKENTDDMATNGKTCCSLDDVEDARSVAYNLDMPYYVFNFKDSFKEKVIDKFVACYEQGLTPNPCIDCNRYMKFEKLYERAMVLGCDKVVTGHYARIRKTEDGYQLLKGLDETKDQSYVLYSLTQQQLAHTEFPLGEMNKSEVRKIADDNSFVNADKPDSQDICFVPDGDYAAVIKEYSNKEYPAGDFVDKDGNKLGEHKGIIHYTIGQRKGLGIAAGKPIYVCKICTENNTVVLGDNEDLFTKTVQVKDFNWISGKVPTEDFECKAKIRYRQKEQPARIIIKSHDRLTIEFDEPQRAATPGQSAVLYMGDVVLGGGIIYTV